MRQAPSGRCAATSPRGGGSGERSILPLWGRCRAERGGGGQSSRDLYPIELDTEVFGHHHRGRAAGTEHAAARMLERADEVEPLDPGHAVLAELGGRAMR